jgi:hypothetical protein
VLPLLLLLYTQRIDARRREHLKQRSLDSKRLLQRNRNVQAVLEAKQSVEGQKLVAEIRKSVLDGAVTAATTPAAAHDTQVRFILPLAPPCAADTAALADYSAA